MTDKETYAVINGRGQCMAFLPYNPINKIEQLEQENAELKAENERLKKEIRLYDCIEKWGTKQCRCACRCLGNEFCEDADKRIDKYKQTLQEIKDRIPKDYEIYQWYEDVMQLITKAEEE